MYSYDAPILEQIPQKESKNLRNFFKDGTFFLNKEGGNISKDTVQKRWQPAIDLCKFKGYFQIRKV